jgi:aromatic ring-opening dioxygenase catalytic subunit (LigB family)
MSTLTAGMASSHAATVVEPSRWDRGRAANREAYARRYGTEPVYHPKALQETMDVRESRYKWIRDGLDFLRAKLQEMRPDAVILVGDDQDENFSEENWPQLSLYVGEEFYATLREGGKRERGPRYQAHAALAKDLLAGLVERDFDVSYSKSFPEQELRSHAHCQILDRILPEANIPVIPMFVNATHPPIISPRRCFCVGQALREIIDKRPGNERVVIFASGGISHFPAGFPWRHYKGSFTWGSISEEFDRRIMEQMARGEGSMLAQLTSEDLINNGNDEMRSWIIALGAIGKACPELLNYEALYSAGTAMGVGYWNLSDSRATEQRVHLG